MLAQSDQIILASPPLHGKRRDARFEEVHFLLVAIHFEEQEEVLDVLWPFLNIVIDYIFQPDVRCF